MYCLSNILEIKDLVIHYETIDGLVQAVNGASLAIKKGKTVGLVGETGAGKTTLAKGIMRLINSPPGRIKSGQIIFEDKNLLDLSTKELMHVRGKLISMIFQDPMTSLNPVMTVGEQIAEVISHHENLSHNESMKKAKDMLEMVGIPGERLHEYAHQFSGGMKQRVVIAIALACNPRLLIADEPTTALDVTIQAQLLELMNEIKHRLGTSMLLITHDLGVVAQNCDYVAVMYAGEIVEYGTVFEVFDNPTHPYTIGLFDSIPKIDEDVKRLKPIDGLMPDPINLPQGCSFNERCEYKTPICFSDKSELIPYGENEHIVRCHNYRAVLERRDG